MQVNWSSRIFRVRPSEDLKSAPTWDVASSKLRSHTVLVIVLTVAFWPLIPATGQRPPASRNQQLGSTSEQSIGEAEYQNETAAALRAQLVTAREYEDQLLKTVHWTLGAVVSVAFLIGGFSWYTNTKVYERDKDSLRQHAETLIQGHANTIQEQFRRNSAETLASEVKLRADLMDEVSRRFASINGELESLVERSIEHTRTETVAVHAQLNRLRCELIEFVADMQETHGAKPHALTAYRNLLGAAKTAGNPYAMIAAIRGIVRLLKNGATLFDSDIPGLLNLLGELPAECSVDATSLKELIQRVRS